MAIDYVKCRGGICNILQSNNLTLVNMPQVKISGYHDQLEPIQSQLIKIIEDCFAEMTGLTADKIVQRCYPNDGERFALSRSIEPSSNCVAIESSSEF
jgi:hypothetical protein